VLTVRSLAQRRPGRQATPPHSPPASLLSNCPFRTRSPPSMRVECLFTGVIARIRPFSSSQFFGSIPPLSIRSLSHTPHRHPKLTRQGLSLPWLSSSIAVLDRGRRRIWPRPPETSYQNYGNCPSHPRCVTEYAGVIDIKRLRSENTARR
jgi:hypothetical protein